VALGFAASPVGCATVLDIDEAYVFITGGTGGDAATGGGSGGTDASGGSGAVSGAATGGGVSSGGTGTGGTTNLGGSGGSGATSSGGSGGTSSGGSGGTVPQTLCGEYCATVLANCDPADTTKPRLPQYNNMDQCLAVCALLPPGQPNDRNVNTVECRLRLAKQAEYEPLNVCPQAGIAGVDACGSTCEAYCGLMNQVCTEASTDGLSGHYYFDDAEDCLEACSEVPDMPPFSVEADLFAGNHLQCRLYHLLVSTLDGIEHCEHAVGYSICADE
jgi:hypothetical protein